jgi:hypothetical protein
LLECVFGLVQRCVDLLALLGICGHVTRERIVVAGELIGMLTPCFDLLAYSRNEHATHHRH